ncbi:mitochondrial aldehyde dehydrogenase [Scheffersomyces amazonensis]|uniref:mitochondrial aldehyde dehydrogenase n=1 Tax=Scheffersomyces amazonensis TaxID=1078765 RepID=UPI00315D892F
MSTEVARRIPLIIGGKENTTRAQVAVNSHTFPEESIHTFTSFDINDTKLYRELFDSANKGFEEWSATPYNEKIKVFQKAVVLLKERKDEFFKSHHEIGGPSWFAGFNVDGTVDQLEEYISQMSNPTGVLPQSLESKLAITIKQPIGPVLAIAPWNAPILLAARSIAAPLAAGCSVIHKSSEKSPLASYLFVKCLHDAGLPKDALQLVHVAPQDNPQFLNEVLSSGTIKKLNFTGSTAVGTKIATVAANYLIPYLLELGGKNFSIVRKDADLDKAVGNIVWSSWSHKGQICMSTDKVYIHEDIYDEFKERLQKVAPEVAKDPDYSICQRDPVFTKKIIELVEDAVSKGANILYGNIDKEKVLKTNSVPPLILEDVNEDSILNNTESFGPLFSIHKYNDEAQLIKDLNVNSYGLKATIWSQNILEAIDIAKNIETGAVHINSSSVHDEVTIPHGGVKGSGQGRFNSSWGLDEFNIIKTITLN